MKRQRFDFKIIVGIVIFVVYALVICGSVHAETYTYRIDNNLTNGEVLPTRATIFGDNGLDKITYNNKSYNARDTIPNYFFQVWKREIFNHNNWSYIATGATPTINTHVHSDNDAVKLPSQKYVVFAFDKIADNYTNLYDISNGDKLTKLKNAAGSSGGVGFAHGLYSCYYPLSKTHFVEWDEVVNNEGKLVDVEYEGNGDIFPYKPSSFYNFSYMMAFYKSEIRDGKLSGFTNVQDAINVETNNLRRANNSYDSYSKRTEDRKLDFSVIDSNVTIGENYYKVGTIKLNNYLYYSDSIIAEYSGKNVVPYDEQDRTRNILGGIVNGDVVLEKSDGTTTTFQLKGSDSDVYVSTIGYSNRDNYYPRENQSFNIYIKKSLIETDGYSVLKSIKLKYRKTEAEGNGLTFTYLKTNPNTIGTHERNSDWSRIIIPLGKCTISEKKIDEDGNEIKDNNGNTVYEDVTYDDRATVTVTDKDYSTPLNIKLLQSKVSIINYIYKVNGSATLQYVKDDGVNILANTRRNFSEDWKKSNPVPVEVGDKITYKVEIRNEVDEQVKFKLSDVLPSNLDLKNINIKLVNPVGEETNVNLIRTNYNRTIITGDLPTTIDGEEDNGKKVNSGEWYILLKGSGTAIYEITATVGKHNSSNLCESKASLTNIYDSNANEVTNTTTNLKVSSDYFVCKQYNVGVYTYISKVSRNDGSDLPVGEVVADSMEKYPDDNYINDETHGYRSTTKTAGYAQNFVYVENGDQVKYTIEVSDNSNNTSPYYSPKNVNALLEISIPKGAKIKNITGDKIEWDGSSNTVTVKDLQTKRKIQVILETNINSNQAYGFAEKEITTTVKDVINCNGKKESLNEIINNSETKSSSDHYKIKEYNVAIDTYISNVIHTQSIGTKATYNSSSERKSSIDVATGKSNQDDEKDKNPVYVEYGDEVTYNVTIYNTTDNNRYNCGRSNDPYKQPQYVTLDLTDILPEKYSNLYVIDETIDIAKDSDRVVKDGNNVKIKDITVGAGSEKTLQVIFVVEDVEKDKVLENKVQIDNDSIRNINGYRVVNNSKRTYSSDKYKLNSYSVTIDEYISQYNAEMAKYNNAHEFTEGESEGFSDSTTNYTNTSPLNAEKNETLTISTKVTNTANGGEDENNVDSSGKYNTRVRPTDLTQTLANGLSWKGTSAVWHKADGTEQDITSNIEVTSEEVGNTKVYQYKLKSNKIILSPGEYIIYNTTVEITESNEYLGLLESVSQIVTLTNVNRSSTNDRIVTAQNTETKTSDNDYVRLKDLIIAGNVWLDENRDGYKNGTESGKKDIEVKLYKSNGDKVAEAKTNENGFYNFGRQWKSSTKDKNNNYTSTDYINYYIEFEYDGTVFKSTEVYGGINTGNADGTGNLSNTWRQGYSDLPGNKSGKIEYIVDSNAYEFVNVRASFNNKYKTIGYNCSYNNTTPEVALNYDKTNHISIFKEDINDTGKIIKARSFIKQNYSVEEIEESISNTKTLPLYSYEGYSNTNPETEYMKYINLGLVLREKVDVSLDSDVVSVETSINGEQFTYELGENTADSSSNDYTSSPNAYKLDEPYKLKLDSADYNYRYDEYYDDNELKDYKGEENELAVKVNYRITLRNKAITNDEPGMSNTDIPIETAINEVAIYYDANFVNNTSSKTTVKKKNNNTGIFENLVRDSIIVSYNGQNIKSKISSTSKYGNNIPSDLAEKGYNALYLTDLGNVYIQEGESKDIDISFFVDKDTARALKIFDTKENNMGLELISEITAYSTRYSNSYERRSLAGKNTGLIDCDSNPGNIGLNSIEDYNKYEDDTYKVGIKIMLKNDPAEEENPPGGSKDNISRKISGFVWKDLRSDTIGTSQNAEQYIGDGKYTSNEEKVAGVKVTLMEISQKGTGIYYEKPAKYTYDVKDESGNIVHYKGTEISTVTDASGNYILDSFIPGYYVVRFDYGYDENNARFNGQDYKSTTYYCAFDSNGYGYYTNTRGYKSNDIGSYKNFNYFDYVKESLEEANLSDAQDDEIRRLNVNSYSETMTTAQAQVFAEPKADFLTKNTWMYAEGTIFYVKPEKVKSAVTTVNNEDIKDTSWKLDNLDFGLVYRPQASIILDKEIDNLEIITSDNKTLVKLYFKEQSGTRVIDEEKSVGYENIQFLPNNKKETQGFVYINMDTDILQGTTMKVHYTIDATNNSEVDRVNTNLDRIKYLVNASDSSNKTDYTGYGVYINGNYSANGTAANALSSAYYNGYVFNSSEGKESFNYLTRLKKPYTTSNKLKIGNIELKGTGYYGMYLGEAYYTGSIGANDVETELKVDNILDYIDNDFTFSTSENNTKNNTWSTKTSLDLEKVLNWNKVNSIQDSGKKYLVDKKEIRYDTDNRSNLALTVDTNRDGTNEITGNTSLSRFLSTKKITNKGKTETTGTIGITVSKSFSAEELSNGTGLNFENIAEVVQYTSLTGRRTIVPDGTKGGIIGNANVSTNWTGYNKFEDDTDATELITITPPTGLTK